MAGSIGWNSHEWVEAERFFTTEQLGLVELLQCRRCGRDFIDVFSTGTRPPVFISILSFWTLSPDASERWSGECPGRLLASDDADRKERIVEIRL